MEDFEIVKVPLRDTIPFFHPIDSFSIKNPSVSLLVYSLTKLTPYFEFASFTLSYMQSRTEPKDSSHPNDNAEPQYSLLNFIWREISSSRSHIQGAYLKMRKVVKSISFLEFVEFYAENWSTHASKCCLQTLF